MNNQRLMELAGVRGKQLNEQSNYETFTIELERQEELTSQEHQEVAQNIQAYLTELLKETGLEGDSDKLGLGVKVK